MKTCSVSDAKLTQTCVCVCVFSFTDLFFFRLLPVCFFLIPNSIRDISREDFSWLSFIYHYSSHVCFTGYINPLLCIGMSTFSLTSAWFRYLSMSVYYWIKTVFVGSGYTIGFLFCGHVNDKIVSKCVDRIFQGYHCVLQLKENVSLYFLTCAWCVHALCHLTFLKIYYSVIIACETTL